MSSSPASEVAGRIARAAGEGPAGRPRWWATKVRQFGRHLRARIGPGERETLATWLTPAQLALFDRMHRADRRHGLDVVARLRAWGVDDPELLLAGLLHDCGKGETGVWPRVLWSLGELLGPRAAARAAGLPLLGRSLAILAEHEARSAALSLEAGCSPRTAALIRAQARPEDPVAGELLRRADEAS